MLGYAEDAGMVPEAASEVLTLTLHMLRRMLPDNKSAWHRSLSPRRSSSSLRR